MAKLKPVQKRDDLEKLLIYILSVAPDEFGLLPDQDGFVTIKELLSAVRDEDGFRGVTENSLLEINNRPSAETVLEMAEKRIRLKDGFRPPMDKADRKPVKIPKLLYFGLKPQGWPAVAEFGLKPKPGHDSLLLFPSQEKALQVAKRACPQPALLTVHVGKAQEAGAVIEAFSELMYVASGLIAPSALSGPPISAKPTPADQAETTKKKTPDFPAPPPGSLSISLADRGKTNDKYDDSPAWKINVRREKRRKRS
ncbi:MAG: hypothetical protein LBJ64_11270 [Deltaproteobacteria bacterium]|jgi:putative RNA 2'-phosphotransferase|nr:hypothetical protein [Deltaproteobacteria bacterium]